jgi:beta-glucanase (GH16 family)
VIVACIAVQAAQAAVARRSDIAATPATQGAHATPPTKGPPVRITAGQTGRMSSVPLSGPTRAPQPASARPIGIPGHWPRLIFDDEFSGTSLDRHQWSPNWYGATDATITDNVNPDLAINCNDPAQVTVGRGHLDLTAAKRTCNTNDGLAYPYASGLVSTYGKFQFRYGAMEARIRMPGTRSKVDNWPAWWADGTGTWPTTGEIDVVEGLGSSMCWHFHYSGGAPGGCTSVFGDATGWHTYAADWEPGSITYYYDGVRVGQIEAGVTSAPMYLVLFQQVRASIRRSVTGREAMQVDYVRVWQH